jgi:hypothetical protein
MNDSDPDPIRAHRHSSQHRAEVMASEQCGCFHCGRVFGPAEIERWLDAVDGVGHTAVCPHCGIDSVIGSASGSPLTRAFLWQMYEHWFGGPPPAGWDEREVSS